MKCLLCGFKNNKKDVKLGENYVFYLRSEPICQACYEDNSIFFDCGFKPSDLKVVK